MPLVRHLFYWLGGRPASKATVRSILARNGACVLIPGGVAEVTEIQHGSEVAFMHSRLGFVKLALEHGELARLYVPAWHAVHGGAPPGTTTFRELQQLLLVLQDWGAWRGHAMQPVEGV